MGNSNNAFLLLLFFLGGGGDIFFSFLKETIANWVCTSKVKGNSFQGKLSKDPDVYVFILIKINMHNILCLHDLILTLSSLFSIESKKMDIKCNSKVLNVIASVCTKQSRYFWTCYSGENRFLELIRNQVWNPVGQAHKMFILK